MSRQIYLDNAATTVVLPEVVAAMLPFFTEQFGNPSSIYSIGATAKDTLSDARERIADHINARPGEIYFTGSGSEADNWALKATMEAYQNKGRHLITSAIEHHAILHAAEWLEKNGFEVTYLPVDGDGLVDPDDLRTAIRPNTTLVSVMMANNEIGTIQPIAELAAISHEFGALFHTDAVQALAHVPIDVSALGIDMLSAAAHKFHGPKGVGFLYIRKGIKTRSFIHGGAQENKRRAGTENVPGIIGMAAALDIAMATFKQRAERDQTLRDVLINRILTEIDHSRLNGHREQRLPNNANFSFEFVEGEALLLALDQLGIIASTGSACASGSLDPSHVLLAIGLPHEIAHGSLRLTVGEDTTPEDIDYTIESIKNVLERLRAMSPLYEDFLQGKKPLLAIK